MSFLITFMQYANNITSVAAGVRQYGHPYGWFVVAMPLADISMLIFSYVLNLPTNLPYFALSVFGVLYFARRGKIVGSDMYFVAGISLLIQLTLPKDLYAQLFVLAVLGYLNFLAIFLESFREMMNEQKINIFLLALAFNMLNGAAKLTLVVSKSSLFMEYTLFSTYATLAVHLFLCYFRYDNPALVIKFGEKNNDSSRL